MIARAGEPARPGSAARQRVVLQTVELGEVSGFVIPSHRYGSVPYRGYGDIDYSCGRCGHVLAIGVQPGVLRAELLACGCGALNKVPPSAPSRAGGGSGART